VGHDGAVKRLLVLAGLAALLGMAGPAQADPGIDDPNLDASFLASLTQAGVTIKSAPGAVKAGKAACGMMEQGRPQLDVVQLVMRQNPGLDMTKAAKVTAIAASAYCPQYLQRAGEGSGATN